VKGPKPGVVSKGWPKLMVQYVLTSLVTTVMSGRGGHPLGQVQALTFPWLSFLPDLRDQLNFVKVLHRTRGPVGNS
jgi:hypothetical protein